MTSERAGGPENAAHHPSSAFQRVRRTWPPPLGGRNGRIAFQEPSSTACHKPAGLLEFPVYAETTVPTPELAGAQHETTGAVGVGDRERLSVL